MSKFAADFLKPVAFESLTNKNTLQKMHDLLKYVSKKAGVWGVTP